MSLPIPIDRIDANPYQPRQHYDQEALDALADDIAANGLLQPPPARVVNSEDEPVEVGSFYRSEKTIGEYFQDFPNYRVQLAFGHRRFRAIRQLGMPEMQLELSPLSDDRMDMMAWSENKKRADLTPLEEAQAIADRIERHGWTQMEAAEALGIGRSTVANKLRLLRLPDGVQRTLRDGQITERQAQTLLSAYDLTDEEQRLLRDAAMGPGAQMHHPGNCLTMARNGESSGAIRDRVKKMKAVIEEEREAQAPPEGWRIDYDDPGYVARRSNPGLASRYLETSVQDTPREAAEAARSLVQTLSRNEEQHEDMSEKDISDLTATEAAEQLRERYSIDVTIQRGTGDLRAALTEAKRQAAKEQPQDAADLEERLECMPDGLYAEDLDPGAMTVHQVQQALGQVKSLLRDIDRRDTWVREAQQPESAKPHGLVKAKYGKELVTLSKLRKRTKAVQEKLRDEWLPAARKAGDKDEHDARGLPHPNPDTMHTTPQVDLCAGNGSPQGEATLEPDEPKTVDRGDARTTRRLADRLDSLFVALDELHEDMKDAGGLASGYVKNARDCVSAAEGKIDEWQEELPGTEDEQSEKVAAAVV